MTTVTLQHTVGLVAVTCINCGVVFGIEENHQRGLKKTKDSFYCPNGHSMVYRESETDRKLKEALKSLDYERENVSYWRDEAEKTQRSLSATKGVLTKTKKRIANGVCPCCHRQFVNLQRHMSGQHPDYEKEG